MSYRRYQRSDNRARGPIYPREVFFVVLLLFIMGVLSNPRGALDAVIGITPLIFLGVVIFVFIKRYRTAKRADNSLSAPPIAPSKKEIEQLNYSRHTSRHFDAALNLGEEIVADTLARGLDYGHYYIFNNVIIPPEANGSAQIDHVVVSEFGVFVIESKNYSSWIFGGREERLWTQSLPGADGEKKTFQFQNPLHQNYGHVKSLEYHAPFLVGSIFDVVVFLDKAEFKTDLPENVVHLRGLVDYIEKFKTKKLPLEQFFAAIGFFAFRAQANDISAEDHIENVRRGAGQA